MDDPTNSEVLSRLGEYHADVKVALDRTVHHAEEIKDLYERMNSHSIDISKAKGTAATVGVIMSGAIVGLIELFRPLFGGHH